MIHLYFFVPLFIALLFLITALVFQVNNIFLTSFLYHLPPIAMTAIPLLWFASTKNWIRFQCPPYLWMYVGFLSPLAVIYPWIIVGQPPATEGYLFFMQWLGKEPNFGPVNFQVFFAILCLLAGAMLPSLFTMRMLVAINIKPLLIIFFLNVVVFIPVFFKMDLLLWYHAISLVDPSLVYGPVLRTMSLIFCTSYLITRLK